MRSLRTTALVALAILTATAVFSSAAEPAAEKQPAAKPTAKPAPKAPTTAPAKPAEKPKAPPAKPAEEPKAPPAKPAEKPKAPPAKPAEKPKAPPAKPAEPPKKPVEPPKKPAEPVKKPAEPPKKPVEPPKKPAEPVKKPAEPAKKPAEPPKKPAEPVKKPAEPAKKPAEPPKKPVEPATKPAEPATKPVEPPKKAGPGSGERNVRFQFDGIPYMDVVRRFAQMTGRPMLGGMAVAGSLTFHDSEPYTYEEALDTLNIILAMRGYILRESGRFLKLVPLASIQQEKLKFLPGLDATEGVRAGEIVTVLLPLKYVSADAASKIVVRMVSAYGSIAPLGKGKGVIITDHLSNIRRIAALLKGLDAADIVERQLKTIQLQRASARAVADIINKLFGQSSRLYTTSSRYRRPSTPTASTTDDSVSAAFDERTNMIFLMGSGSKLAMAEEMIKTLDSTEVERQGDMRIVELVNARAEDLVKTITPLLPSTVITSRSSSGRTYSRTIPNARIVADAATNRVIISAPVDAMASIEEIIKKLDTESKISGGVKIFQLKYADASQLAPVVSAAVARQTQYARYSPYSRYRPPTRSGGAVSVTPDTRTNSLIVVGPASELQAAETLIKELDREIEKGTAREVHVVQLPSGVGRASSLAATLERMFEQQSSSTGSSRYRRSSTGVRIQAEPSTNSLLISATPGDWTRVKELLDKILPADIGDAATTIAVPVTKMVPLKVAKAGELAETLRSFFTTRRQVDQISVLIVPNDRTNTLLISAAEADHKAMAELIKTLDVSSTEQVDPIEIVKLKTADANKVAAMLRAMLPPVPRWGRRGGTEQIYIHPDPDSNSVIIRAPEAQRKMIQEMISKLDKADQAGAREMRIVKVKNVPASQMATTLSQLFAGGRSPYGRRSYGTPAGEEERITITPAPGDKALLIEAPRKRMEEIVQLVENLDQEGSPTRQEIRTYTIAEGSASEIATNLSNLFSQRYGRTGRGGLGSGEEPPRFEVNVASNQLLVSATAAQFERIELLLKQIQSQSVLTSESKTFVLKYVQAGEVLRVLSSMLQSAPSASGYYRARRSSAAEADLRLAILPGTNAIVMQGPPNMLARAEELIKSMDTEKAIGASVIHIIALKSQKAETVAASLRAMLPAGRGQAQDVFIQADTVTNSILLRAPESQRKMVEELIAKLDQGTPVREMRVIPVEHTSASSLAQTINVMYQQPVSTQSWRSRTQADPTERIVVTASPDDKSLIVEAPVKKMEAIAQLVKQLDTGEGTEVLVRTYQLKNANAAELAGTLGQIFAQRWAASRRGAPQSAAPQPTFQANAATNQLIVAATAEQFVEIEKSIADVEKASVLASATKTFTLEHAKADELVSILTSMLQTRQAYSRYRSGRYGPRQTSEAELRVASLPGTNTLVVQGPPDKIARAEELIKSFDTPDAAAASVIQIVELKNQNASKLAETLRGMLPQGVRGRPDEVTIQADPLTNSLLIRASEKQRKMVQDLIAKLDMVDKPVREMKIVKMRFASAFQVASTVETMYQQFTQVSRGRYGAPQVDPAEQIVVTASPDDRSLIVDAPVKKMPQILQLISDLDTQQTAQDVVIRTYQLRNANAAELATSLGGIYAQRSQEARRRNPKTAPPQPTFQASAATNLLIVGATAEQFEEIEKSISDLEKASVLARATKTFQLQHAQAEEMVSLLQSMLQTQSSYRSRWGQPAPTQGEVRIAALVGTNSVVVQGPPDKIARAEELIKNFDTEEAGTARQFHMIALKNATASAVAETLRAMIPQQSRTQAQRIFIQADTMTNSVLIRAPESDRKMVEEMIAKLDAKTELVREMRVIPLKFTSAAMLAESLRTMYAQPTATRRILGAPRTTDPAEEVIITASPNDRSLVVEAPAKRIKEIEKLVTQLDVEDSPSKLHVRTYKLSDDANPTELAQSLSRLWLQQRRGPAQGPEARFEAEVASNQLMVAATTQQFEEIEKLLKQLDAGGGLASRIRTFPLKFIKASELLPTLQAMLVDETSGFRYGRGATSPAAQVRVSAVISTNSIIVQGPPAKLALAEELIKNFDTKESAERIVIQIVKLQNAQAPSLAAAVNAMLARQAAGRIGRTPGAEADQVVVTPEPNSNSLLVRGPAEDVPAVIKMIEQLDKGGTSTTTEVRVFPLKNSDATELAASVGRLFQDIIRQQARGAQDITPPAFSIAADGRTNSLVISTTAGHFGIVEELLKSLDQEAPMRDVRYIWLENADAADVVSKLESLFSDRKGPDKPVIEADEWDNAITVIAKDMDMIDIETMVGKLDKASRELQIRVVPVSRMKAEKMAEIIKRVYGQMTDSKIVVAEKVPAKPGKPAPPPSRPGDLDLFLPAPELPGDKPAPGGGPMSKKPAATTRPASAPAAKRPAPATQPATRPTTGPAAGKERASTAPTITIAIDPVSNSLIISAPPKELADIEQFMQDLSIGELTEAEYRNFKIEQANPVAVAETLDQLFNPKPPRINLPRDQRARVQLPPTPPPVITVVPDLRTRTLIVRAKPLDFEIIEPLIKHLDSASPAITELRVFPLENTDATEVARNLQELFQMATSQPQQPRRTPSSSGRSRTPQSRRADSLRQMMEMQMAGGKTTKVDPASAVSISANKHTNSVIVSAPKEVMTLIEKIIQELDQSAAITKVAVVMKYPLKNAEVQPTVEVLRELFTQQARATRGPRAPTPAVQQTPIIITGDEAAGIVIVSAPKEKHELIAQVIEDIDSAQPGGKMTVKVYKIESADATSVASALTAILTKGTGQVGRPGRTGRTGRTGRAAPAGPAGTISGTGLRISADASSNSVVVRASQEDHVEIAKIIKELDIPSAEKYPVQMIPLVNADPTSVAATLTRVFGQARATAGRGRTTGRQNIVIEADPDTRMIVVRADEKTFAQIRSLVAKLDAAGPAGRAQQTIIALQHAQASSVAAALQQAFAPRRRGTRAPTGPDEVVTIVAEPMSNSLIVTANQENLKKVQALLKKLDTETAGGVRTELMVLEKAKAADVAAVLSQLVGGGARSGRGARGGGDRGVAVSADVGSNTLVMSGPAGELTKLMQMARQLDESTSRELPGTFIISLTNGEAVDVARMVQTLYNQQATIARRERRPIDPLAVTSDEKANAVVMATTKEMFAQVQKWVSEVEKMKAGSETPKVITLQNADPAEVEQAIRTVFIGRSAVGRGRAAAGAGKIELAVLPEQRAILVKASEKDFTAIETLVKKLDAQMPVGKASRTIIPLKHADASTIGPSLVQAFAPPRGKRITPDEQVTIVPEPASNSIIVMANAENLTKVQSLIAKLDTEGAGTKTQFMVLQNAKATELAAVLTRVLATGRRATGKPPVTISADAASNALVMSGPASELAKVTAMAQDLDKAATAADTGVYIVKLKTGEAPDLATMIQQLYAQQVQAAQREGKSIDALSVSADEQANALILATTPKMHKQVTEWVNQIEAMKPGRVVPKIITLANADAAEVERAIRTIFAPGRTGRGGRAVGKVETAVLPQQQAILVKANDEDFKAISELVKSLDAAEPAATATRTIIPLKHAQAPAIATALTQAFAPSRGRQQNDNERVNVVAEPFSNSIIVIANAKNLEKVNKLLAQLDTAQAGPTSQFVILKNAKAADLATVLTRVLATRGQAAGQQVVISADTASNALLLSGPSAEVEKALAMADELDQASAAGKAKQTILPLKHAKASAISTALTAAFTPPRGQRLSPDDLVRVTAEPLSNTLIVTASDENLVKVKDLLAKLDTAEASGMKTEVLLLRNTKATDLEPVLSRIASAGQPKGGQAVTVSADAGSNALIMAGTGPELANLMAMAQQLDQATLETLPAVHIIQLTNGDAVTVAATIEKLYSRMATAARAQKRSIDPLAISADERANALIVATTKPFFEQVTKLVADIEKMKPKRGQLRLITIEHADPEDVDKAIKQLFDARGAKGPPGRRGQTSGGRVESTVLPAQRAILVDASDEDYEAIQKLVKAMEDAAAKVRKQVKLFQLKKANNTQVATALTAMFRAIAVQGRPEDQVQITALPQTNAIVVAATPEKLVDVASLIEQLDQEQIIPELTFKVFPLKNAQPDKVLPALKQMLVPIQQTLGKDKPISVQADQRTRSIIVTAHATVFDQIGKVIEILDQKPAQPDADVLIIPLKKADAPRLAGVLQEMLRPSATAQITPEARELQEQIRLLNVRSTAKEKIPQLDLRKPIKISSDPETPNVQGSNSLIVTSTPDNLKAMRAIVELMDVVPLAEGVRVRVIRLKNADAATALEVLREIFDQAAQQLSGRPGTSVAGKAEPESVTGKALVSPVAVAADMRTNTLIISGVEESLAFAELILIDLDRVEGQIVTEVRLFRLKHADATRMAPLLQSVFAETAAVAGTEGLRTQITRLKTVLEKDKPKPGAKDKGHATDLPKARAALTIQADQSTNMLVVAARSDVMPLIADVIRTMDVPGAGSLSSVRIVPLENADATRIQQVLSSMYTGPNAQLMRDEDKPTIVVDTRTNALVISANDKTFAILEALIRRLDGKTPIDLRDIRLIPLKNAEAGTLAATLQKMMDARVQRQQSLGVKDVEALRVIVEADPRSNSLIIGGSAEGFKIVQDLAQQLDGASPALAGQIQLFPLKEANAGTLSSMLGNLFNERYAAAPTPDVKRQKPIILPDLRTNSLLVAATPDDTKVLIGLLAKLDVKETDPTIKLVVIPLKHNDAGVLGPTIDRMFQARNQNKIVQGQPVSPQDKVDVQTDALSNSLIVSASKENLALLDELLKKVDVEPPEKTGIVRMYPLKTADAQRVATLLQGLISQGLYKPGVIAAGQDQALAAREKVAIEVDIRTNVLIVSASKENFAVIDEIIKKVDAAEDYTVLGNIKAFVLKRADATRLAQTLQSLFTAKRAAEQAAGSSGRSLPVSIIPDPRTNTLLVAGSRESFRVAEELIKQLDGEEVVAANEFRVFQLKHATATVLQPTLDRLFAQRAARGTGAKDAVTIIADARVNSLIVGATPEDMKVVEAVVTRMDVGPDKEGKTVHVFPLSKADATQVASTLQNLYRAQQGAAQPASITVDERINAIIVSAGSADVKRISELITQLDTGNVTRVTEIRVFTLENADATELATILTDVLTEKPKPLTSVSANRQTLLQFIATTKDGKELISQALQEGVLIIPDRRTNSLVVTAPVKNLPLLGNLIRALDSTNPQMAEIRVFTLKNADARQMADILTELFRLQQTTTAGQRSLNYTLVKATTQPATGKPQEAPTASAVLGPGQQYALSVTVDVRTNSLLIGGTKQYVGLASSVIEELDASPIQEREIQIYRLRNAQASEIQTALRTFLDQERQTLTQTLGTDAVGAAQRLLEHEVAVVAEETSNTLLLSASPRYFNTIQAIIEELDQPPPQVLIQVLLAEVTLDDTTDWGFEWQYRDVSHRSDGTVKRDIQSGTDFSVSAAIQSFGGFSASLTGGDLSFYFRALQAQGKVEILSRPQILASDNQEARINIGQRVPFVRNTRVTDQGSVFNTIEYEDIGIILQVTPRINPDGFVKMEVRPEISSLTDSSVEISEGLTAPVFNSRIAETTITVQDGHTIVIGGLITTKDEERETKVPILGDVPVLGVLFRTTRTIKQRTELLIILTPHVIRDIGEADTITDKQLKRLDLLRRIQRDELKEHLFRPTTDIGGETDVRYPRTRTKLKSKIIPLESLIDRKRKTPAKTIPKGPTTRPANSRGERR